MLYNIGKESVKKKKKSHVSNLRCCFVSPPREQEKKTKTKATTKKVYNHQCLITSLSLSLTRQSPKPFPTILPFQPLTIVFPMSIWCVYVQYVSEWVYVCVLVTRAFVFSFAYLLFTIYVHKHTITLDSSPLICSYVLYLHVCMCMGVQILRTSSWDLRDCETREILDREFILCWVCVCSVFSLERERERNCKT